MPSSPAEPGPSGKTALGVVLFVLGLPLQLFGHGVAAIRVLAVATDPFDAASAICWDLYTYNESAWYRCLEPASQHPLDLLNWPTFLFPLPGLILSSIGAGLVIRSAVGHVRRERFAWRVLITAWILHLHGWLLLWMYFRWSDVPRWIALVAASGWALTVILVVRVRWARIHGRMGPEVSLLLADFGIASVASALTICAALLTPFGGVDGVLFFGASPAGAATAFAGILGVAAAVATRSAKSPGRGSEIPQLGDVPRSTDP